MKKYLIIALAAAVALASCGQNFQSIPNDPLNARIYTLDNGLSVYMTVNKDAPRIQTYIAVRAGGKNDPSDNTGLAHYLEHMMFKGSQQFGTRDYEAEKPMLEEIDSLFEVYRTLTGEAERRALYHKIDSISYEASKLAIPNEYDKLMSIIGSEGSNAYTSNDVTCYVEEIPSNQIDAWARIEADRFKNCVFRGFHTELEAVFEEKNMGLADDDEKAFDALDSMLFVHHPYGTQTVIGTQDHLKNPSLRTIRSHKDTYYVPNNVAICLSGDFDPDEMINTIRTYFGDWQPNPDLPEFTFEPEEPITTPKEKTVVGYEAEFVAMAWRTPGASDRESEASVIVDRILNNGLAGLIDLDLIMSQKVLDAGTFVYNRTDYGMLFMQGQPKEGQTLEEVRDLMLEEVAKLREGDFPEELVTAAINNYNLQQMRKLEENSSRASMFVDSFINGTTWADEVSRPGRIAALTKSDIVEWANKYLGADSYAVVYKKIGEDTSIKKIDAPEITPIVTNREFQSEFLQEIAAIEPAPIDPVFVDFSRDLEVKSWNGLEFLYKKNEKNDIASLTFRFDKGSDNDPVLDLAADYLAYLGTADMSPEDISTQMYSLACDWGVNVGTTVTSFYVSGLSANIGKALDIVTSLIEKAEVDEDVFEQLKADLIRSRADAKKSQGACNRALRNYVMFGKDAVKAGTLSSEALASLTPEDALGALRQLWGCSHKILYYGPAPIREAEGLLAEHHSISGELTPLVRTHRQLQLTPSSRVVLAPYDSRQFNYMQYSCRGEANDFDQLGVINLFNEYYGGGMNAIVFQEMRESRALAYSAGAFLMTPDYSGDTYAWRAVIASQNDKLRAAVEAFDSIIEEMPLSPENFEIAKAGLLLKLRTQRVIGKDVLTTYLRAKELGLDKTEDEIIYSKLEGLSLDDIVATHERWIKGRTYVYAILGDPNDLNMAFLRTLGPVERASLEDIFGY